MNVLSDFVQKKYTIISVLILVPALVYYKSLFYSFSPLDEQWLIVNNTNSLDSWKELLNAFGDSIQKIYYRPLFVWSLIIDYQLGGTDPFIYHLSSLVIHLIAVQLLYRLLLLLQAAPGTAFVIALLFSVHPALAHAVAWVPGRNDSLLCLFTLLSLIYLIKDGKQPRPGNLALHLLFFLCALFTKETALVLPALYLLLSLRHRRFSRRSVLLCAGWLIGLGLWFWLRQQAISLQVTGTAGYAESIQKFILAFIISTGKAILPFTQSVSPTISNSSPFVYLGVVILFSVLVYRLGVRDRFLAGFGILSFFLLMAVPVWYGIRTPLGEQYEHRVYTPLAGLMILLSQVRFPTHDRITGILAGILCLAAAGRTFQRIEVYRTPVNYLLEGVADCPENYIFLFQTGTYLHARQEFSEALVYFNQAIAKQPGKSQLYYSRAQTYARLNRQKEAIADYSKAISLYPAQAEFYLARCSAYLDFGDPENALRDIQLIKQQFPDYLSPVFEMKVQQAWLDKKLDFLNKRIREQPGNAVLYVNRAKLYFDKGLGPEALADLKKACELEPANKTYKAHYDKLNSTFPH